MAEPGTATHRRSSLVAPVGVGLAGGLAAAAVGLRDPHVPGSWGLCPLLSLTGLYCPGCGGLRAVHDLVHLHPVAALGSNAVAVVLVVALTWGWVVWLSATATGRAADVGRVLTPTRVYLVLLAIGVFTVLRNTAAGSFLAP